MKHLKEFESYSDIAEEIAQDLLPKLQKIKDEKGIFTVGMFDNYMEERKQVLDAELNGIKELQYKERVKL